MIEMVVKFGTAALLAIMIPVVLPLFGIPVPIGYDRGKIKFNDWCHTGMHPMTTYWWGDGHGFQTLHPADAEEVDPDA
jgi:hypothetical protein